MFKKTLALKLLKIIDEKQLTVSSVAELSHLSRVYVTNIISEKQTPSIDVLENLCAALETEPNELLISEQSRLPEKSKPLEVKKVAFDGKNYTALCPACEKKLHREYLAYCSICGQRLSWKNFVNAEIINMGVMENGKLDRKN